MESFFVPTILGIFCVILGAANWKGNLSTLHWYHRRRVAEEDRPAFGRAMGLGTMIVGAAVILYGLLALAAELTKTPLLAAIGGVLTLIGVAVGVAISLYALIRYNKGIF